MNNVKPCDLTELQWLLLRHLHKYSHPFNTEFLYAQFSRHQIDRLQFYYMFFSLAVLSYIKLDGYEEQVPGQRLDFRYIVTPKGRKTVAQYTQAAESEKTTRLPVKRQMKGITAAYFDRTIKLKDYTFNP